jgi:hypothetical protein
MIERVAITADLGIKAHPHLLRHACGYKLAKHGVDSLPRASQYPEHDPLYGARARSV